MGFPQDKRGCTLQKEMRYRLLLQLGFPIAFLIEGHWKLARLKKGLVVEEFRFPVEVVFEIEPRVGRHEQVSLASLVSQAPNSAVARSMYLMVGVVPDDGFQVSNLKGGVSHAVKAFQFP
jgi:hypothetical protein